MNQITHPIEPEELMAYLDGELTEERESVAAAHLSRCEECRRFVAELQSVSKALKTWDLPHAETPAPHVIEVALTELTPERKVAARRRRTWRDLLHPRRSLAWAGGFAAVLLIAIGTVRFIGGNADSLLSPVEFSARKETLPAPASPPEARQGDQLSQFTRFEKAPAAPRSAGGDSDALKENAQPMSAALVPTGPMIIRTAQLSLITKDFDKARESVESILRRHRGYIGELKIGGSSGSGRTLTGTLRVPADQLDSTIVDLKPLGRVESESQSGQDVTSQYVDLQARLTNARNTEQRLTDLLRNRTGKLSDVLEVEQELDRVRGEIEQMEAERKNMSNQVNYATLNLTVTEDYKAQLQVVPPSTSTRLSNAAVEGYRSVVDGVLGLTLFLLSTGPSLLFWGAVLFFPARFAWKFARRRSAQ